MATAKKPHSEIYVLYTLKTDGGLYDKDGTIEKQTEETIVFSTQSETYRVIEDERIERKQGNHWYCLGEIKNIHIREDENE